MTNTDKCPLCEGQVRCERDGPGTSLYNCKTCGRYVIDRDLKCELERDSEGEAFRLACVMREMRARGNSGLIAVGSAPIPQDDDIQKRFSEAFTKDELLAKFPTATQIIDRALLNLSRLVQHPMESINRKIEDLAFLLFCPVPNLVLQWKFMKQMGVIHGVSLTRESATLNITPTGWGRIEELSKIGRESRQAFVAMWFDPDMDKFYEDGIKPAIQEAGYDCTRIDTTEHNNKICDEIIAEIRKSRFVVADFTAGCCKKCDTCEEREDCKDMIRPRGGVYFEAGFAMGLDLPVIWLVRKEQIKQVHFDTRQYNHIVYESAEDLKQKLYNRIAATIH